MKEAQAGTILNDRYVLIEKIGRGGMANVWLGEDKTLGRKVAIKVMLPQFSNDVEFSRRFKREAAASAHLQSPYIVNIYDWGLEDSIQYIVMEFVQGEDLKDLLTEHGAVAPKKAANIGIQICKALAVAHQQDIIHRDIKPQNIMVQPDGNIKVMDFGIARAKNSTDQKTQVVLGTAHYVSPEQARGMELTAESDVYSLGIVLYEMITGRVPFDGSEAVEVAMKHCNEKPIPPSSIVPNLNPQLESIIMKALSKNPKNRFASAIEMGKALDNYVNGQDNMSVDTTMAMPNVSVNGETVAMPRATTTTNNNPRNIKAADNNKNSNNKKKSNKGLLIGGIIGGIIFIAAVVLGLSFLFNGKVNVPDVVGQSQEQAIIILEESKLKVGDIEEIPNNEIEKGKVVETDPKAGSSVNKNSSVKLKISSGPQMVEIPNLTNMTEDEAKEALSKVGLKGMKSNEEASSTIEKGRIVSQNPVAMTEVEAGSTVLYIISSGAESVSVPDLSGLSEQEAIAKLEEVKLMGLVGSRQPSETVEAGKVISQNPHAGMKVNTGTQITFTISIGKETITVPSLIGFSQNSAKSTLINNGFVLGNITEEYSDEQKGSVISQSIEYGEKAPRGTVIDIVISKGTAPANSNTNTNSNTNSNSNSSNANSSRLSNLLERNN